MRSRALIASALLTLPAQAASIEKLDVTYVDKRYSVVSEISIAAPIEAVFGVLADYDRFERVSSIFKDSRYLERDEEGNGTVYTLVRECIAFFCKSIERTETLELIAPTHIKTVAIPERSDLRFGESTWTLKEVDKGTRIYYEMHMEPNFWVPPVIGPYLVKRFLADGSLRAAERVEYYANEAHP